MILTINANAAVDMIIMINRFLPGETMRPERVVQSVGGKALDASVVLSALGAPVKAVTFAAGRNGETLAGLLKEHGVEADLIWVAGETRVANVIVETDFNRHSHITTPGYSVTPADCQRFSDCVAQNALQADRTIIAGSLPGGAPVTLYGEITRQLHDRSVPVLIDAFGPPVIEALPASPEVVKMNQSEFISTFKLQPESDAGWIEAVHTIMDVHGIQNFVLTCGKKGILAFTQQAVYLARAPLVQEVNAAGSGDAVSAAITYRLSLGESWEQALAWAAAAGAAVALTEGTAECRLEDVRRILEQTSVEVV